MKFLSSYQKREREEKKKKIYIYIYIYEREKERKVEKGKKMSHTDAGQQAQSWGPVGQLHRIQSIQ